MKQSELENQLGYSNNTLQRYRNDINMLSSNRIHPNNNNKRERKGENTKFDHNSHRDLDVNRPQMTSNYLKSPQSTLNDNGKKVNTNNNLRGGSIQENIEINDQYLHDILDNNNKYKRI